MKPKLPAGFKKITSAKILLPLFLALTALGLFIISQKPAIEKSQASLSASQNKFQLSFQVSASDQENFSKFLIALGFPPQVKDGISFTLDKQTSAKLALSLPLKADLEIEEKLLKFEGTYDPKIFSLTFTPENVKIPQKTQIATVSQNQIEFVKRELKPKEELLKWLEENSISPHQYLISTGENSFVVIFKSKSAFTDLKNVAGPNKEPVYKEETRDDNTLLIFNPKEDAKNTPAIFHYSDWFYLASSPETARKTLDDIKSQPAEFPRFSPQEQILFYLVLNNSDNSATPDQLGFILKGQKFKQIEKIQNLELLLKEGRFSGLINLK